MPRSPINPATDPGPDYVERQERRTGESLLAYYMRIAALREGRWRVMEAIKATDGNVAAGMRSLGVDQHNYVTWLKRLGLRRVDVLPAGMKPETKPKTAMPSLPGATLPAPGPAGPSLPDGVK